jgi:hypothetical protein
VARRPLISRPSPKALVTPFDGGHGLVGFPGYDVAETTDENPERVEAVQRLIWAFLRSELYPEDTAWAEARSALTDAPSPLGRVESK